MRNLATLIAETESYVALYARQYDITDENILRAIYVTHLAYLVNINTQERQQVNARMAEFYGI